MLKKPWIHLLSLLLLMTFTQISVSEESDKPKEIDKDVSVEI